MRFSVLATAVLTGLIASLFLTGLRSAALAHCEVPCGIYTDNLRVVQMLEDCSTVEKAINKIQDLAGKTDPQSLNQVTRWINTKEQHATKIQTTIAQYFMHQRIKPVEREADGWDDYVTRLTQHHAVMVNAMKTKQSVDAAAAAKLRESIEVISVYYPVEHPHPHEG